MKVGHRFTLGSRYRHKDDKYWVGVYNSRGAQKTRQNPEKNVVYIDFDTVGIQTVSIDCLAAI